MALTEDQVRQIAYLARLRVADGELGALSAQLGEILEFVAQLQAAETEGIAPMAHPLDQVQRLRADEVTESDHRDAYQRNAPAVARGLYLVPRVIE